jgi:hypothetical protein
MLIKNICRKKAIRRFGVRVPCLTVNWSIIIQVSNKFTIKQYRNRTIFKNEIQREARKQADKEDYGVK